jgi:phosphohistidine phosphatase SixA
VRYLVRHADAGDKHTWNGPDDQRPLSDAGRHEADGLVDLLAACPIDQILSSPAIRCRQTVQPLAQQRHLEIRTDPALAVDADPDRAVELLLAGDHDVVWCTHGELIKPLLTKLHDRGAPISDEATWPKGSVWVLETAGGTITNLTYLPPTSS